MSKLPLISGQDCGRVLAKMGYIFKRQEGSHMIYRQTNPFSQVVVPRHKVLDRGTLRAIIRQTGRTLDEFLEYLK